MRDKKDYSRIKYCCSMTTGAVPFVDRVMPDKRHQVIEHIVILNEHGTYKICSDEHALAETVYLNYRDWLLDRYFDDNYDFDLYFDDVLSKKNKKLWNDKSDYMENRLFFCRSFYEYFKRVKIDQLKFYEDETFNTSTLTALGKVAYKMVLSAMEYISVQVPRFAQFEIEAYREILRTGVVKWTHITH